MSRLLIVLCLLMLVVPTRAQDNRPAQVHLTGLTPIWQDFNRCSAAAFTMQLSYFGWRGSYTDVVNRLNPNPDDVSVRLEEMAEFALEAGFGAVVRTGGTIDLLTTLVAGGFPVLVENAYYDGNGGWNNWMSHNRVLMGYDLATQTLYFYDPLLGTGTYGEGYAVSFTDFEARWRHFNHDYIVLYHPQDEATVRSIMGEQWDVTANARWTLEQAQAEHIGGQSDSFTLFNMGVAQVALGDYATAAATFDRALALGVPWRLLWYEFAPFEAYLAVGRYADVLHRVQGVLADMPHIEELYYYAGRAYEGMGNLERATANYRAALFRNPYFTAARAALSTLEESNQAG